MAVRILTTLAILPVIFARVHIDMFEHSVQASGLDTRPITDADMKAFKLTEEKLKDTAKDYFGAKPDELFLKSPTPFGDLYMTFKWNQIERMTKPTKAQIYDVKTEPISLKMTHNANEKTTFKPMFKVQNSMSSMSMNNEMADIDYEFHMKTDSKADLSFSAKLGESMEKIQESIMGSNVEINLKEGQTVMAELQATKVTMKVQVDFETSLNGDVAMYYEKEIKGHHFWSMDIETMLKANGMENKLKTSEFLEYVYFTDGVILIKDVETNQTLYTIALNM